MLTASLASSFTWSLGHLSCVPSHFGIRLKTLQGNGHWCLPLPIPLSNVLSTHAYVHVMFLAALNSQLLKAKEQAWKPRILAFLLLNITARALLPTATGMLHKSWAYRKPYTIHSVAVYSTDLVNLQFFFSVHLGAGHWEEVTRPVVLSHIAFVFDVLILLSITSTVWF